MKVEEFISSGVLESYVLGNASPEEIRKVQEMEKLYPEVREELNTIEKSLMDYASAQVNASDDRVKQKMMERLFSPKPTEVEEEEPEKRHSPLAIIAKPKTIYYVAAASIAILIGSLIANYILYNRLKTTTEKIAQLNSEKAVLAEQFNIQQVSLRAKDREIALVTDTNAQQVLLKGLPLSPNSSALAVWNTQNKSLFINIKSLPPPPANKQYQLWALVEGSPVDMGVFDVNEGVFQKMKDAPNAQAFAVTLEKVGGSPSPTLEAMYLLGAI